MTLARRRLFTEPEPPVVAEPVETLRFFRVTANAIFSRGFTGKAEFGTYSEKEHKRMHARVETLRAEGYQVIDIVEVL
jgi:hypothetical protein